MAAFRYWLGLISLAACTTATAQALDFKGSKLGDSVAAFQEQQRGFQCTTNGPQCSTLFWRAPPDRDDMTMTYAGEPVRAFTASFVDDRLVQVEVVIKPTAFDRVVAALRTKFGQPTSSARSRQQTQTGGALDQQTLVWARKEGQLTATRYGASSLTGLVTITSAEHLKAKAKKAEEAKAKAPADL